jgi:hypothetical protein
MRSCDRDFLVELLAIPHPHRAEDSVENEEIGAETQELRTASAGLATETVVPAGPKAAAVAAAAAAVAGGGRGEGGVRGGSGDGGGGE